MLKELVDFFRNWRNKQAVKDQSVRFIHGSLVGSNCSFEGSNSIGERCKISNVHLGFGTYTGKQTELSHVKVGRFCSIGSFVRNTSGRHPTSLFVSTHPAFFSLGKAAGFTFSEEQKFNEIKFAENSFLVTIGNDVWVGDNVTILDGISIGDGAVIGANSLVTKDVPPYSINVGIPAKTVKFRFKEDDIKWLLNFKWWEKDIKWIKENSGLFSDLEHLRSHIEVHETN